MDFTTTGEKLASVGQAPDFMLTVWDWKLEKVILHCKAFGQDISKVTYSVASAVGGSFGVLPWQDGLRVAQERRSSTCHGSLWTYCSCIRRLPFFGPESLDSKFLAVGFLHVCTSARILFDRELARLPLFRQRLRYPHTAEIEYIVLPSPFGRFPFHQTTKVA